MRNTVRNDFFSLKIDTKNIADAIFARVELTFSISNVSSLISLCKINLENINKQIREQVQEGITPRIIICLIFPEAGQNFEGKMFDQGINFILKSSASKTIFNDTDIVAISYQDKVPRTVIDQMVAYVQKYKMAAVLHGALIRLKNQVELIIPQPSENQNKYILITGGSRGIGKAAADILALSGKNLIVTTRKINEKIKAWAQILANTYQIKVEVMELSLRDQQSCEQLANKIKNQKFQLSGIVHNAAVGTASCLEQVNEHETFQETLIKINSIGPVQLQCELQKAGVVDKRCCITIVSSVGGTRPFKEMNTIDNNSKCILDAWAAELSKKYPLSILYPGCTDTDMFRSSTLDKMNKVQLKDFIEKLPKQMLIQPEMIGEIIEMTQNQNVYPYFNLTKISANCGLQMDYRPWEGKK